LLEIILIAILALALVGALPRWSHSRNWVLPDWRSGTDPLDRYHSHGSRSDLNQAPADSAFRAFLLSRTNGSHPPRRAAVPSAGAGLKLPDAIPAEWLSGMKKPALGAG
jgi:Protein of unknown function (DUF3309)